MLKLAALTLPLSLAACIVGGDEPPASTMDPNTVDAVANTSGCLPSLPADSEYGFYNGKARIFTFTGFYSDAAETFFIWNLGTTIQHGAPYPDASHGRLYAVFTAGPCGSIHHVAGQDQWDHYHVITQGIGQRTFDVELVFPGASYDATKYDPPKSEEEMLQLVSRGVLGAPLLTTDAGFGPLVVSVPVQ